MKPFRTVLLGILAASTSVFAETEATAKASPTPQASPARKAVAEDNCHNKSTSAHTLLGAHEARYKAMVHQDMATLDALLGQDLVYSHSDGDVENKKQFLKTVRSGRIRYFHLKDLKVHVREHGNWAILTGVVEMDCVLGKRPRSIVHLTYTAVYEKRAGHWTLTAWQSTMAEDQPKQPKAKL